MNQEWMHHVWASTYGAAFANLVQARWNPVTSSMGLFLLDHGEKFDLLARQVANEAVAQMRLHDEGTEGNP